MRTIACGPHALILADLAPRSPYAVARAIESASPAGVLEAWASYETVGLEIDPSRFSLAALQEAVSAAGTEDGWEPRTHRVPVCYEMGEDLEEAASALGITSAQFAELHASVPYRCHAIGFCPGFPYLGYLPDGLLGLPRRQEPRVRVPAGSVGVTGNQTGIYPTEHPGGWMLIGRTPLQICDWREGFFPIVAGDVVQFEPLPIDRWADLVGRRLGER